MKPRIIFTAMALAVSLPLYAEEVPVLDAEEMPSEIVALAQAEAIQKPLISLPTKQAAPQNQQSEPYPEPAVLEPLPESAPAAAPAAAASEPAPLFEDDSSGQKMVQSSGPPAKPDMIKQLQSLQNEITQLRGQLEMQQHELKLLNRQHGSQMKDLESRATPKAKKTSEKIDPDNIGIADEPTPDQSAAKEDEINKVYQEAFVLVRAKKYAEAAIAMEAFIKVYPDSQYTPNAYYWLGELYMAQGLTDKGIQQFTHVINQFPTSSKAAAATLKLGYSFYEQSRWQQARYQFGTVIKNYPNSSEATLAKGRLHELDQQGL